VKVNKQKLDIALARECKTLNELNAEFSMVTLTRLRNDRGYNPTTKTVGRLAKALKCSVEDLIEVEQ
jgi:DNA-binding Xre family transcriptional regulator